MRFSCVSVMCFHFSLRLGSHSLSLEKSIVQPFAFLFSLSPDVKKEEMTQAGPFREHPHPAALSEEWRSCSGVLGMGFSHGAAVPGVVLQLGTAEGMCLFLIFSPSCEDCAAV